MADPRLAEAVAIHTDGVLAVRHSIRDASKLLSKEERYRAFTLFAILAAEGILADSPSIAFGRFYDVCTQQAGISDRTAKTVAALLVHFRFAESRADGQDRRRKSLVPTARMARYFEAWGRPAYEALDRLGYPSSGDDLHREMLCVFAGSLTDYSAARYAFFANDPAFLRVFALMEGGSLVCMSAISATTNGLPPPSRAEIATRFAISRAQITRVVNEGRASGLFEADGAIVATPRLYALYLECEATVLAFIDVQRNLARARLAALDGDAPALRSANG